MGNVRPENVVVAALANVGDTVICNDRYAIVTAVKVHAPGTHKAPTVHAGMVAREVITPEGSRWHGHWPGQTYKGVEVVSEYPDGISFE